MNNLLPFLLNLDTCILLSKMDYTPFDGKTGYFYCDGVPLHMNHATSKYLFKNGNVGIKACTSFEVQQWLTEKYNLSVEPQMKSRRVDAIIYEVNIVDIKKLSVIDYFTIEGSYHDAMKAGILKVCKLLNKE